MYDADTEYGLTLVGMSSIVSDKRSRTKTDIDLMRAARTGNIKLLEERLRKKASKLNESNRNGVTALMLAVFHNKYECVRVLVEHGASLHLTDKKGNTPLMIAVWKGYKHLIPLLMLDNSYQTRKQRQICKYETHAALRIAVMKNFDECLDILLTRRSAFDYNPNSVCTGISDRSTSCRYTVTPLMDAAHRGRDEFLTWFLQEGSTLHSVDSCGRNALMRSVDTEIDNRESQRCLNLLITHGACVDDGDSTKTTPLMFAAWRGNQHALKLLVDKGAVLDKVNEFGATALKLGAYANKQECCEVLVNNGADCNVSGCEPDSALDYYLSVTLSHKHSSKPCIQDDYLVDLGNMFNGMTPLMCAAQKGNVKCLSTILEGNTDVNLEDRQGATALMLAVIFDKTECVHHLIQHGRKFRTARVKDPDLFPLNTSLILNKMNIFRTFVNAMELGDLNTKNNKGQTLLMLAAVLDRDEGLEILLAKGVELNSTNEKNETALMQAIIFERQNCATRLIDFGADVNIGDSDGVTPLMEAAFKGQMNILQAILSKTADQVPVNATDATGATALMKAAQNGHDRCVELLLRHCKVDQKTPQGLSALMVASLHGQIECVKTLIKHEADVNVCDDSGVDSLMAASYKGFVDCVEKLVEAGAEVNKQDVDGITPLMRAAEGGHHEVLRLLIDAGAETQTTNKSGENALTFAHAYDSERCAAYLSDNNSLIKAVSEDRIGVLKTMLYGGLNPDLTDSNGETALMHAAWYGRENCVRVLLEANAAVEHQNVNGLTALCFAAAQGNTDCVRLLLEYGAKVNVCDDMGVSPLMDAASKGHYDCLQLLLLHGSIVDTQDCMMNTALMNASKMGHTRCVKLLLLYKADIFHENINSLTAYALAKENGHHACCAAMEHSL